MILEGGSIDVNGAGALLTSESCLLNKNRNPNLSREEIEQRLRDFLGVREILWLGDGIEGDDTDGHIDDLTRFVSERAVVTVIEENRDDKNYEPLQENLARLKECGSRTSRWKFTRYRCRRRLCAKECVCPRATPTSISRIIASYCRPSRIRTTRKRQPFWRSFSRRAASFPSIAAN